MCPQNPHERLFIYHLDERPACIPWERDPSYLGCWVEEGYAFLFFNEPSFEKVNNALRSWSGPALMDHYEMSYWEWQGGETIEPLRVGRLLIQPYWREEVKEPGMVSITIDPGVVFGAGAHPTTRDCLKAMTVVFTRDKPRTVLDLGTGTGILALAAAGLDAKKVVAVDLNPLCVRTARANVQRNGLQRSVQVKEADAVTSLEQSADLVIANIHMKVMEELVASPYFAQKKWAILSGLMRSQARTIEEYLRKTPAHIVKIWESEGIWTTFLIRNTVQHLEDDAMLK